MSDQLKTEIFEYLDDLRDSGITNMWGAPAFVQSEFGLDRHEARAVVSEWMGSK